MLAEAGAVLSGIGAIGGLFGKKNKGPSLEEQNQAQLDLWKGQLPAMVEGAKSAGLHPLVAAGVNPAQASYGSSQVGDSWSDRLSSAGQNISRAASAMSDRDDRMKVQQRDALLLEKMKLENDLLRSQITTVNRSMTPPVGGSSTGSSQGSEYGVQFQPKQITMGKGSYEAGHVPANANFVFNDGDTVRGPSSDFQQAIEDSPAHWYHVLTRTVPDMALSDAKYVARKLSEKLGGDRAADWLVERGWRGKNDTQFKHFIRRRR